MNISDGLMCGHSVGDANGVILSADSAICDLLRLPAHELIGRSYLQITHPDDRASNAQRLSLLTEGEPPIAIRKRYLRDDGSVVPVEVSISRLSTGEREGRLIGTVRWHAAAADAAPDRLWRTASRIEALTDLRRQLLGADLFPDHPMGMLLRTYIAEMEGRTITLGQLSQELGMASTLADRWLAVLTSHGLLDPVPAAGAPLQLSDRGVSRLEHLLRAAG